MKRTKYFYIIILLLFVSCFSGELIDSEKSNSYFISSNGEISYSPNGNWFELGVNKCDSDNETFRILSNSIAKDKDFIFYTGLKQEQVDYNSFYLDNDIPKDKNNAYTYNFQELKPIRGIEPQTFEYLKIDTLNKTWSRDKNHYYLNYNILNVDRETFKFINRRFSKDKDSLYADLNGWKFITISKISKDFKVINSEYIRDDSTLYYVSTFKKVELLKNNLKSFDRINVIDNDVICVNNTVIYYGKKFKFENVDAKTFDLYFPNTISSYSKDINNVYYDQEIISNADPNTYLPLKLGFGKDKNNVYYETKLLKGVDSESFEYVGELGVEYKDKLNNKFNWKGKKL